MMKNHVPKSLLLCNYFKFVNFHMMHNLMQTYGVIMYNSTLCPILINNEDAMGCKISLNFVGDVYI